jgi:hypothetical protein
MEPKGSLPFSQQPATGSYSESDESSPHLNTESLYDPLHILTPYFLKIHLNIILQPMPGSEKLAHLQMFLRRTFCHISHSSHAFYVPRPSYWFNHPSNIKWGVKITKIVNTSLLISFLFHLSWVCIFPNTKSELHVQMSAHPNTRPQPRNVSWVAESPSLNGDIQDDPPSNWTRHYGNEQRRISIVTAGSARPRGFRLVISETLSSAAPVQRGGFTWFDSKCRQGWKYLEQ